MDTETAPTLIESLLTRIGSVDLKLDVRNHEKRFEGLALFANEGDAREAVATLHETPQDFLNLGKLFLQLMHSARFKVSVKVYAIMKNQLDTDMAKWRKVNVEIRLCHDAADRFVTLKLESEEVKEVALAGRVVGGLLAGTRIDIDNKPFWTPELAAKGQAFSELNKIQHELGVLIMRNKAKRELRFFGASNLYPQVQQRVLMQLAVPASAVHEFELTEKQFAWGMSGRFCQNSVRDS